MSEIILVETDKDTAVHCRAHRQKQVSVLDSSSASPICSYIRFIPTAETFTHDIVELRSRVLGNHELPSNQFQSHFASATMSPPASSFPISNSRILPLPSPLMTSNLTHYSGSTLPGITTPQQYHSSNEQTTHNSHHYYYSPAQNTVTDSYFPTTPDSRRTARSDSKPSLHSISSILSATAMDTQSESSSSSSSPMYYQYWAASPTGTSSTTPRTSSMASTPLSGYGTSPVEYVDAGYTTRDYGEMKEEDGSKRKIRRFVTQSTLISESNTYIA